MTKETMLRSLILDELVVVEPVESGHSITDVTDAILGLMASAVMDGPLMDCDRGIVVASYDPDELHQVELDDNGWTILHPLRERLDGSLFDCEVDWSSGDIGVRGRYWLDIRGRLGDLVDRGES